MWHRLVTLEIFQSTLNLKQNLIEECIQISSTLKLQTNDICRVKDEQRQTTARSTKLLNTGCIQPKEISYTQADFIASCSALLRSTRHTP
jgi:hypothetical protein